MSGHGKTSPAAFAAYGAAGLLYCWLALRFNFVCDDAFISYRYSARLAAGGGLAFDAVRTVPVEGYSNLLWVVLLSLFERAGADITLAARTLSAGAGLLLLVGTLRLAERRIGLGPSGLFATGLFLASLPAFGLWATGGLATMPAALAAFGVLWALHADEGSPKLRLAACAAVSAVLLRADGVGYVGLILLGTLAGTGGRAMRAVATTAAAAGAALFAQALWRHGYYGEWVPNTAKIKAAFTTARLHRGLLYTGALIIAMPALALGAGFGLRKWREGPRPLLLSAALLLFGSLGYATWVGGDFMPFGRFLVPALPAVALLFAWGWSRLSPKPAWALTSLCILASIAESFDHGPAPEGLRSALHFRQDREFQTEVARWAEMKRNATAWDLWGRAIAKETSPGESMILGGIGAIGYRALALTIYDTYGLVTPEVAAHTEPIVGASPGHDVRVQNDFFLRPEILSELPSRPTYLGAQVGLARPLAPGEAAPEWLLTPFPSDEYLERLAQHLASSYGVRLETISRPLSPEDGFPEDSVLRLLRLHYD